MAAPDDEILFFSFFFWKQVQENRTRFVDEFQRPIKKKKTTTTRTVDFSVYCWRSAQKTGYCPCAIDGRPRGIFFFFSSSFFSVICCPPFFGVFLLLFYFQPQQKKSTLFSLLEKCLERWTRSIASLLRRQCPLRAVTASKTTVAG